MLPRVRRRVVAPILAGLAVLALLLGAGVGAVVSGATDPEVGPERTALGPVSIALPDDVGPWEPVPADSFDAVRASDALGDAVISGAWGEVAPGAVVVTVLTAAAGTHGGLDSVRGSVPTGEAGWDGRRDHAVGEEVLPDGVRVLMLAVESDAGDLVIVSVSGPEEAFESGSLVAAFRDLDVD